MFKKMIMIFSIVVIFQLNAMKQEPCHLDKIPYEVQNLIASFLMHDDETQEEFIDRTSVKREDIILDVYDHLALAADNAVLKSWEQPVKYRDKTIRQIKSFNTNKIVLIQKLGTGTYNTLGLTIVDTEKKEVLYSAIEDIDRKYLCFALSSSGKMIASVELVLWDFNLPSHLAYKNELKIKNFDAKKARRFQSICTLKKINSLDFNKQGTHIIIRGSQVFQDKKDVSCYQLFSLKEPDKDISMDKIINVEKTLRYYLREKFVCKAIKCQ